MPSGSVFSSHGRLTALDNRVAEGLPPCLEAELAAAVPNLLLLLLLLVVAVVVVVVAVVERDES